MSSINQLPVLLVSILILQILHIGTPAKVSKNFTFFLSVKNGVNRFFKLIKSFLFFGSGPVIIILNNSLHIDLGPVVDTFRILVLRNADAGVSELLLSHSTIFISESDRPSGVHFVFHMTRFQMLVQHSC